MPGCAAEAGCLEPLRQLLSYGTQPLLDSTLSQIECMGTVLRASTMRTRAEQSSADAHEELNQGANFDTKGCQEGLP